MAYDVVVKLHPESRPTWAWVYATRREAEEAKKHLLQAGYAEAWITEMSGPRD